MAKKRTPMHSRKGPSKSIKITSYKKLKRVAGSFANGEYGNVIIVGPPGVGKTVHIRWAVQEATGGHYAYLNNHATPFGFYTMLWHFQDMPLIIDDIKAINSNPASVGLLMAVTDSSRPKAITWTSKTCTPYTEPPSWFETESNVAIITNQWDTLDERVKALEDRCMCFHFVPTPAAIHAYVGTWFDDQEIYDWMGPRIFQVRQPSIRSYLHAKKLRDTGAKDWQDDASQLVGVDRELGLVIQLELSKLKPDEKMEAFMDITKKSKATYYRLRQLALDNMPDGGQDLELPATKLTGVGRMPVLVNAQPTNISPDMIEEIAAILAGATTDQEATQQAEA